MYLEKKRKTVSFDYFISLKTVSSKAKREGVAGPGKKRIFSFTWWFNSPMTAIAEPGLGRSQEATI